MENFIGRLKAGFGAAFRVAMRSLMIFNERDLFFDEVSLYLHAINNNILNGIDFCLDFGY